MVFAAPTPAELKAMFPAFAAVPDDTVAAYIVRANRMVDDSWTEGDYAYGIMLLACHLMVLAGLGTGTEAQINAGGMAGFRVIKSGQLQLERASSADDGGTVPDEFSGSAYGRQFYWLLKRNKPAVAVAGGTDIAPGLGFYPMLPFPARWF